MGFICSSAIIANKPHAEMAPGTLPLHEDTVRVDVETIFKELKVCKPISGDLFQF